MTRKDAAEEEKQQDSRNTSNRKIIKCYNCNKHGHTSKDCTFPIKEKGAYFTCNEQGHQAKNCPKKKDNSAQVANIYDDPVNEEDFRQIVTFELNNARVLCLDTLLDTGSLVSFIKERFIGNQELGPVDLSSHDYVGVNNSPLKIKGIVKARITLFGETRADIPMYVVPEETTHTPALIGRDLLRRFGLTLSKTEQSKAIDEIMMIELSDEIPDACDELKINPQVNHQVQTELKKLFQENYIRPERPVTSRVESELKLSLNDAKPFHSTPRRLSYYEKERLREIVDRLLEKKYIRQSKSEYSSPIVLTTKKNGETRMCIDSRRLNKALIRDNYPLSLIEDQLDMLCNKKFFTALDLRDGFHHVKIAEDSIKFTSFVTPIGQFEYLRMPFGLKTAPATFQRFMNSILEDEIKAGEVVVYMDDILIASETLDQHLTVLKRVFKLLVENKLELRIDKCSFLQSEIKYLVYLVPANGIRPTSTGIDGVQNFPIPTTTREVQSFIGLCSYFRKFIEQFSIIAKPLYDILKKNIHFKFGETELKAFELLKSKLVSAPILAINNPKYETELHCDASSLGFGSVLMQRQPDHKFHPVFYFSKRTTTTESKYHSYELEKLAIVYALRRFRIYLQGITFKIITDCNFSTMALNKKEINPRISRWALELLNYDYTTEHRPGTKMGHVDAPSRRTGVLVIEEASFEWNLAISQGQDPKIIEIRDRLEQGEDTFFEMRNGLVFRKKNEHLLFYVPEKMERNVLYKYHDEFGHLGREKTSEAITKNYWFPKLREKVETHIKNCLKCIAFSPVTGKKEGYLNIVPKGDVPFSTLHIDHLGPIDRKRLIKRYILVIVDGFTKLVKLYATKTTSSKETINCLMQYFENYSRPSVIVSDRGTSFTSKDFEEFLLENHIKHVKIATASPQANGQAERVNRVLTPILAKLSDDTCGKYWFKILAQAEHALNNTVNKATGETPSRLLFGVDQRGQSVDELKEFVESSQETVNRDLPELRKKAVENINRSQQYNKQRYDKK